MFRQSLRLSIPKLRDLMHRLDYFEKEIIDLKAFRKFAESSSSNLASASAPLAKGERTKKMDVSGDENNSLSSEEFMELNQFYALQKEQRLPMVNMLHIRNIDDLCAHGRVVHREYLVRVARRSRALTHAPMGLSLMPSIQELRRWYDCTFHGVKSVNPPTNLESAREFDSLTRAIFSRHSNVSASLAKGMHELGQREKWDECDFSDEAFGEIFDELQKFFDEFCTGRVRLRFLVGNYMYLSTSVLQVEVKDSESVTAPLFFGHDPAAFAGMICRECSLVKVLRSAIHEAKGFYDESEIELRIAGDENLTFLGVPYVMYDILSAMINDAIKANLLRQEMYGVDCTPVLVTLAQRNENEEISVRVSDTAGGMPLEEVNHALKYWSSLKINDHASKSSKTWIHSPIRMAYAHCAARVMGGDISVVSVEGYGTDRTLYFPRTGIRGMYI